MAQSLMESRSLKFNREKLESAFVRHRERHPAFWSTVTSVEFIGRFVGEPVTPWTIIFKNAANFDNFVRTLDAIEVRGVDPPEDYPGLATPEWASPESSNSSMSWTSSHSDESSQQVPSPRPAPSPAPGPGPGPLPAIATAVAELFDIPALSVLYSTGQWFSDDSDPTLSLLKYLLLVIVFASRKLRVPLPPPDETLRRGDYVVVPREGSKPEVGTGAVMALVHPEFAEPWCTGWVPLSRVRLAAVKSVERNTRIRFREPAARPEARCSQSCSS